jgi:Domain of unknown function (DUF5916)/Carbohydrate family 9 binding domain-like
VAVSLSMPGGSLLAQDVMTLTRMTGPIELDGIIDEAAWDSLPALSMTVYTPTFGAPLSEATDIRVGFDDRYLYVGGRLYDSDPKGIRANTFYRDQYSGDDVLGIVIDTYNDHETAVWFTTNPTGARSDRTVSNDAEFTSGMPMNSDWNSHWDVATTETDEGWFAEFRIPFSTLGFQERDGKVTMGMIVYRFIARKNERQIYPAIPPNWGMGFAKPSQAQRIALQGVHASKPIYLTPYVLGGMTQTPVLSTRPSGGDSWTTESDPTTEIGADVKYSPTNNLALDVTVNTDFAQVEADDQQINLTRFPLFFPEKRQFFQERSAIFEFNTGGFSNRLFHSRRIGLEEGEIVRIYGGARLVGRLGGADIGFLDMQTASSVAAPSENMGVLRMRQKVFNPYSTVGGLLTTRLGTDGSYNVAYGLDMVVRPFGDEYATVKWAQTFDRSQPGVSPLDAGLFVARWERRNDNGFSYWADFGRVGGAYLPGLGFQDRVAFTSSGAQAQYKWFQGPASPLRSLSVGAMGFGFLRNGDGTTESARINPSVQFELKSGTEITVGAVASYESVRDSFPVADLYVIPGNYWFHGAELRAMLSRGGLLRGNINASIGGYYDGTLIGADVEPQWSVSKYLELGGGYGVNRIEFTDRLQSTVTHLARLRVQVALNTHFSVNTFLQYNSTVNLMSGNARLRYHFREGTDLWIVYNEGINTVTENGPDPALPRSAGRSLMVKYTYTFIR